SVPLGFNYQIGVAQHLCERIVVWDRFRMPPLLQMLLPVRMVQDDRTAEAVGDRELAGHSAGCRFFGPGLSQPRSRQRSISSRAMSHIWEPTSATSRAVMPASMAKC